jgi:hypothetical protein
VKIEWAFVTDNAEVDANEAILKIGKPVSVTSIEGPFPSGGLPVALPVVIFFSVTPKPGMEEFEFSYTVRDPDGTNMGGRKTGGVIATDAPPGWPANRPYLAPMVRPVSLFALDPGPYEIEIWVKDHREEGVRLTHLLAVASVDESSTPQ